MVNEYYRLAKPGMVYGNLLTTIAAFLFASGWQNLYARSFVFLATVVGLSLVIASACVFNNYLDRDMDKNMERTKNRALVTGIITPTSALVYGSLLGISGYLPLYFFANALTAYVAAFGWFAYVVLYSIAKRGSSHGALVGSVSGGVPIVVGYTAVTGQIDYVALLLFVILALWQMPHFYAIALYRMDDYKKAGVPVLPIQKGIQRTKIEIVVYMFLYLCAAASLTVFGFAGITYLAVVSVFGLLWLIRSSIGFTTADDTSWAKRLFLFSLVVLSTFSLALAFSPLFP